MSLGHMLKYQR